MLTVECWLLTVDCWPLTAKCWLQTAGKVLEYAQLNLFRFCLQMWMPRGCWRWECWLNTSPTKSMAAETCLKIMTLSLFHLPRTNSDCLEKTVFFEGSISTYRNDDTVHLFNSFPQNRTIWAPPYPYVSPLFLEWRELVKSDWDLDCVHRGFVALPESNF